MKLVENQRVRFLALEWREDWEFGHPTVLLEPVIRYSPNGEPCEAMIEDVAIDLAIEGEIGDDNYHHEFEWRHWTLSNLRRVARQSLEGKEFPVKGYKAVETWLVFTRGLDGEMTFGEVR